MSTKLLVALCLVHLGDSVIVRRILNGYRITDPIISSPECARSCQFSCALACGCEPQCISYSASETLRICQLHPVLINDVAAEYEQTTDWAFYQPSSNTIDDGDWTLVFRVTSGLGSLAASSVANFGHHDDYPANKDGVPPGCASNNGSKPCDRHFRSRIFDYWSDYNIQQVKVEVFVEGVAKQHIVFDAVGAALQTWMTPDRIISSSWTDLPTSTEAVTAFGDSTSSFVVNKGVPDCGQGDGWMVVAEFPPPPSCAWSSLIPVTPGVLFSAASTASPTANYEAADVLSMSVKTG